MRTSTTKPNIPKKQENIIKIDLTVTGTSSLIVDPVCIKKMSLKTISSNNNNLKPKVTISKVLKQVSFQCFDNPQNENNESPLSSKLALFNNKKKVFD